LLRTSPALPAITRISPLRVTRAPRSWNQIVYEVLEQRGLSVWLVDARQMKYVPGRKSDVLDCQWLQKWYGRLPPRE
jgi:hypothetical protein